MQFLAGVLATLIVIVSPWIRRPGLKIVPVTGGAVPRIAGLVDYLGAPSAELNVIIVHGMGAGPDTDYTTLTKEIAIHRLGFTHVRSSDEPIPLNPGGTCPARLFVRDYERVMATGTQRLHVYEVHWWPLIQYAKQRLLIDDRYYPGYRAFFNRHLKMGLINERVADPILYLSPTFGPAIRDSVKYTICKTSGRTYQNGRCISATPIPMSGHPTVIVTESLGSEIVSASLDELHSSDPCGVGDIVTANTVSVFMLANQLPLLRPARTQPDSSGDGTYAPRLLCPTLTPTHRQIVAVADPSDLLSYPIPQSIAEPDTEFVNVVKRLGHPILATTIVEPLGAHTHAKGDPVIQRMIACGYPSKCGAPFPSAAASARESRAAVACAE